MAVRIWEMVGNWGDKRIPLIDMRGTHHTAAVTGAYQQHSVGTNCTLVAI